MTILYYTYSQKTKAFAKILGEVLGSSVYALQSKLNDKGAFFFLLHALWLAVSRKPYPAEGMEAAGSLTGLCRDATEIFVCSPVWGGQVAAPVRYFLQNADLKGKKINFLLTCGSVGGSKQYEKNALALLDGIDCIPGKAYAFISTAEMPDSDAVAEQMREMIL